jgi:indolepyruvate ferredoxin oxidoreductase alpha subunit
MHAVSGLQAVAWGLLDGGVTFATAYPGFHAHELAERLGVEAFSVNEKNAFAVAWGASLAGIRSATLFKNVGLNDAADPYVNACVLGVRAGLVLVVLDDIDVEQSQIQQDSRPYADFPCSLWLEPRSVSDAYELARQAPELAEYLGTLVVLRLTNLLTRAVGPVTRANAPVTARLNWCRQPERWVAHPVYGESQRQRLHDRQQAVARWVDAAYPRPGAITSAVVRVAAGMASMAGGGGEPSPDLSLFTLPPPRPWLEALAGSAAQVIVEEHGGPYLAGKLAAGVGADRITSRLIRPEVERAYRITERYEPLYALLRALPNRVVVGDLGGHTLDPHRTIDACLCYGCSVGVATGLALADPSLHVVAVTGDAAFRHSGKAALEEALARRAAVTVIVLDNGGSRGTGGQSLPGNCRLDAPQLECHDLDFPALGQAGTLSALLRQPQTPRLIRLKTPF